jgi:hypothetical protein
LASDDVELFHDQQVLSIDLAFRLLHLLRRFDQGRIGSDAVGG